MKTPLQKIIERFETGKKLHKIDMDRKGLSSVEKNRASYLYNHCDAVISIATELLEEEENAIRRAFIQGGKEEAKDGIYGMTSVEYFKATFKDKK